VPVKEQWLEYKRKLEDSIGFSPMRDRPIYMWYEVERQDVTDRPDGSADPDAWEAISWRPGTVKKSRGATWQYDAWYTERYGAGPQPIVDLAYYEASTGRRHDYALTSPIPIVLLQDIEEFALHPDTPKRKPIAIAEEVSDSEDAADPMADPRFGPPPMDPSGIPGADPYADGGSDPGAEGRLGAYDDSMSTGEFADFDPETGPAAPLKLVRFFDIKAKPGRKYRYRVRVALVDPNNPLPQQQGVGTAGTGGASADDVSGANRSYGSDLAGGGVIGQDDSSPAEVSLRWLDEKARERVKQIRQEDEAMYGKDERGNPIRSREWRFTDWSPISDVVIISERGEQVLAGAVTPPKERRIDENVSFAVEEPKGTLVVSEWNPKYAVEVPAEKEVSLGTLLNFTTKADVLHPIKLLIKRIPEYQFKTDALVLDMRGGQMLPGSDKENVISAPGEFLVIDADGRLHAQNELDDMDEFRLKLLMPDEEELEPDDGGIYGGTFDSGQDGGDAYDAFDPGGRSRGS